MNYAQQQRNPMRNILGFAAVVIFHIFLIYALVNGLGQNIIERLKAPIETKIIQENKPPPPEAPPPPPPQLAAPPPPYIPPPEIQIQQPPPQQNAITAVTHEAPPAPVAIVPQRPAPVQAVPDHDVSERPLTGGSPDYPQQYLDDNREGDVQVSCDVDTSGTTSNCHVDSSRGGAAFAQSALAFVKTRRYSPRTHNGQPVAATKTWDIKFRLGD